MAENSLTRKLNKVLASHDDLFSTSNGGIVSALHGLSAIFETGNKRNDKHERQRLRNDIEIRSINVNLRFLDAFSAVQTKLQEVEEKVAYMGKCCKDMTSRLKKAQHETAELIEKTSNLQQDKDKLRIRREILKAFLQRYQLQPEEQAALSGDQPLDDSFFTAFERVKVIHSECTRLLRTNQQQAGLDIMDEMTTLQERAYERLYAWTRGACRGLTTQAVDRTQLLAQAFQALQHRQVLYRYAVSEYTTTRRQAVSRAFLDALTRGGPGGIPKPIDLESHDPLLYISGILGWLHQTAASERDLLCRVITKAMDVDPLHTNRSSGSDLAIKNELLTETNPPERPPTPHTLMDAIMEGTSRPLQTRWEQVVSSNLSVVSCYKIASTLELYQSFFKNIIGHNAQLTDVLSHLYRDTMETFYKSLGQFGNDLKQNVEIPPTDLYPPRTVDHTLEMLHNILETKAVVTFDSSKTNAHVQQILKGTLEPLLQSCLLSAANLGPADMATFMLNCVNRIHTFLDTFEDTGNSVHYYEVFGGREGYQEDDLLCLQDSLEEVFTDERCEMLAAQAEVYEETLVTEQAHFFITHSGLKQVLHHFQQWRNEGDSHSPMSNNPGLSVEKISAAVQEFDQFLTNENFQLLRQCDLLHSARCRDRIRVRAFEIFCNTVEEFGESCNDSKNKYPPDLFRWKRHELEQILV
eukprot:gene6855-400_t